MAYNTRNSFDIPGDYTLSTFSILHQLINVIHGGYTLNHWCFTVLLHFSKFSFSAIHNAMNSFWKAASIIPLYSPSVDYSIFSMKRTSAETYRKHTRLLDPCLWWISPLKNTTHSSGTQWTHTVAFCQIIECLPASPEGLTVRIMQKKKKKWFSR